MAPHAPFNHTQSKLETHSPLHPHSFEPPLSNTDPRLKDDSGPTPTLTSSLSWSSPYLGVGLLKPTGTDGFGDLIHGSAPTTTSPSIPQSSQRVAHAEHHRLASIALLVVPLLWLIGLVVLCRAQARKKKRADAAKLAKDEEDKLGPLDGSLPRDRIQTMNAPTQPIGCNSMPQPQLEKSVETSSSASPSPSPKDEPEEHASGVDYFSLPIARGGGSLALSNGASASEAGCTSHTTPTYQQDTSHDAPPQSGCSPMQTPHASNSRFTWDFKCAGSRSAQVTDTLVASGAANITKVPSLPPLSFSNPLGELMKLLRGPSSPPVTSPIPNASTTGNVTVNESKTPSKSSSNDELGSISASSTWTAISVPDSLEERAGRANGKPLEVQNLTDLDRTVPEMTTQIQLQEPDIRNSDTGFSTPDSGAHLTMQEKKRSRVALSTPNHRTLKSPTPVLKQLISAAGLSSSPTSLSANTSDSVSSLRSSRYSGNSSDDSASASSVLDDFPAVPLLKDRLAAGSQKHRRTMSDASLKCILSSIGQVGAKKAMMRASLSVPLCVEIAHWPVIATRTKRKIE